MKGDNRRQWETTGDKTTSEPKMAATPTNTHPPHEGRQPETTGDKTTSEPRQPTTPTNTRPPHEGRQPETMGDNRRQDHFRAQEADHTNQHPTPTWRETTGDNGRQDHFRAQEAGHTNQHPTPTWRETNGDNGRQRETRPLQSPRSRPHQPTPTPHMKGDNQRQWETTGDKTTSEPKKPTTLTNTHPTWRETTGDNGRQQETRPLQSPRSRPHQPTPNPHMKGDNRRQRETRPPQSPRSRPHQPTPTPHEGRQLETMGDNGRQDHFRAQEADHTNQHPPHMKGDNWRQWETTGDKTTSEPKKPTTPTNTKAARSKVALRTPTVNCLGKNPKGLKNTPFFVDTCWTCPTSKQQPDFFQGEVGFDPQVTTRYRSRKQLRASRIDPQSCPCPFGCGGRGSRTSNLESLPNFLGEAETWWFLINLGLSWICWMNWDPLERPY